MFYNVYHISNIVFYVFFGVAFLLLLFKIILHITAILPGKTFPPAKKNHKFAILIPARNESKVIKDILNSIKNQTYDSSLIDTYVIVEKDDDPTCEIAKEFDRTHVVVRKHLELKGKGYALDEAMQEILPQNLGYEAYFIFDADNVLDPSYIEEMNKVFDQGYDMALGYRNSKNWNDGWVASCSGITFSIFSTLDNRPRSRLGFGVHVCGTGFYVSSRIIDDLGGWKFFTLTEDYEFTLYSMVNDLKSTYNESAKFYDEQPVSLKQSCNQRIRWCKGFSQVNKIYQKELIKSGIKAKGKSKLDKLMYAFGVIPLIWSIASIMAYQVYNLVYAFVGLGLHEELWYLPMISFVAGIGALYLLLVLYTLIVLIADRKNSNIKFLNGVICCFANPFFMLLYIPLYIKALRKKEVAWVPIEHGTNKK